ncbi:sodium:proton antiporter [Lactiplantibacillus fabifermentans T30PCM01]|uniref:Sodium:proton antiporter n=2 Tax=Lactiplantibacillus fabifermentans TaxID=483011 RepID=W6TAH1_9LACO|nr:Na+/H+ antiporter NhaC [Lactiplantibacillus fabifermentans]ETY75606.1 sodium:proton antiporter [Lactiplantibacillus fabifermentans T30PCM01]
MKQSENWRPVKLPEALAVLIIMLAIMGTGVIKFGLSPQTPVMVVIALVILWARIRGAAWDDIHGGIIDGIKTGIIPIFIFLLIGALISVWIAAGIIPSMMVFGFNLISAQWFVPSVFLVCAIIGTSIGSAFTIISTIGIALFGIGTTMGINPALIAGAIISGAIFGDKTSPLSDSTNLASAIAESDLFSHIRNLMWSTIPAFIVSLVLYTFLGMGAATSSHLDKIQTTLAVLHQNFTITWWAALPLILMLVCALRKVPAIATLLMNIGLAIVMIFIENPRTPISKIATMIESGFVAKTGNAGVDQLLSRGGIAAMMGTVSLILLTLALGGLLMQFNLIQTAMVPLAKRLNGTGTTVTAAILAGIGVNIFVGEQYLSVILPGKAFKKTFNDQGLANLALSRVLEDGGTVINYLIPWGVAGAFAANTLGVSTLAYLPFCFFSLLSPIFSIISGFTGWGLKRQTPVTNASETVQ